MPEVAKLKPFVVSLELDNVSSLVPDILRAFPLTKHLVLYNTTMRYWSVVFPTSLEGLKLIDCRFSLSFLDRWFKRMSKSLISLGITRSYYTFSLNNSGSVVNLLQLLPGLEILKIQVPHALTIPYLPANLRKLEITATACELPLLATLRLESFIYDVPQDPICTLCAIGDLLNCDSLSSLALRSVSKDCIEFLRQFKALEHLWIIDSVDSDIKNQLQSLELVTLEAYCYEPPKTTDLILGLPNKCLLKIFDYLPQNLHQWTTLALVHLRFQQVLELVFPAAEVVVTTMDLECFPLDVFKEIGRFATWLTIDEEQLSFLVALFPNLKKLCISTSVYTRDVLLAIPDGLESLALHMSCEDPGADFKTLFRRLNSTLTALQLSENYSGMAALLELTNLRELQLTMTDSQDLRLFLEQNQSLERLVVDNFCLYDMDEEDMAAHRFLFDLVRLPQLKCLHIYNIAMPIRLAQEDYPLLEELRVHISEAYLGGRTFIDRYINDTVSKLYSLKRLQLNTDVLYGNWEGLYKLQDLVDLEISEEEICEFQLREFFARLKKLKQFGCKGQCAFTVVMEKDLQNISSSQGRTFNLYSTVHPFNRVVFNPKDQNIL